MRVKREEYRNDQFQKENDFADIKLAIYMLIHD